MKKLLFTVVLLLTTLIQSKAQTLASMYNMGQQYNNTDVSLINRVLNMNYSSLPNPSNCTYPGNYSWLNAGDNSNFNRWYNPATSCSSGFCSWGYHTGIDLKGCTNNSVYSPLTGVVQSGSPAGVVAIYNSTYQLTFIFAHLSVIYVGAGSTVSVGQLVGKVGSVGATATHLHLELRSTQKSTGACPCDALSNQKIFDPHLIMAFFPLSSGCVAPSNITVNNVSQTTANISFIGSGYSFYEVSYKPISSATWYTTTNSSSTVYLTGLAPVTTYNFRMRFYCNGSYTSYSQVINFTTLGYSIGCSNISSCYTYNTSCSGTIFTWAAVPSAQSYKLYYFNGSTWVNFYNTSATAVSVGLQPSSFYYLGVQTQCASGLSPNIVYTTVSTPSCKTVDSNQVGYEVYLQEGVSDMGSLPTSINEQIQEFKNLSIFPNPVKAGGEFYFPPEAFVERGIIYDATGNKVCEFIGSKGHSPEKTGIYFIRIICSDGVVQCKKLIVQ